MRTADLTISCANGHHTRYKGAIELDASLAGNEETSLSNLIFNNFQTYVYKTQPGRPCRLELGDYQKQFSAARASFLDVCDTEGCGERPSGVWFREHRIGDIVHQTETGSNEIKTFIQMTTDSCQKVLVITHLSSSGQVKEAAGI